MTQREKILTAVTILAIVIAAASLTQVVVITGQLNEQAKRADALSSRVDALSSKLDASSSKVDAVSSKLNNITNQFNKPATVPKRREVIVQWEETQSGQDRFAPYFIVVNQGDTIDLTLMNNDTVAHNFVIGYPYSLQVNASVPGLNNDVTGQQITVPATNNSPGVVVSGTPGSVVATYSFVAKYAGIFEFVCTYHIEVGMIGYLVVLPSYQGAVSSISVSTADSGFSETSPFDLIRLFFD